jgi:hypothetical protein
VTGGERCDPDGLELLVATTGSDLLVPVVLVAELVELSIRKPVTTTTTKTTTTTTYHHHHQQNILILSLT